LKPVLNQDYRIFLCYASEDKPAVKNLYRKLQADGFQPWLDEKELSPGQDWSAKIRETISNSLVVLICLSHKSLTKEGFVQKEIKFALDIADEKPEGTIFLIPIRLENCTIPQRLKHLHYVDLFDENGYEKIITSLKLRLVQKSG
jgi:hypothetical protein